MPNTARVPKRRGARAGTSTIVDLDRIRPLDGSRSVDRALDILVRVSRAKRPVRFTDLQKQTAIPKGSLHALVQSLTAAGFLEPSAAGLSIGFTAFEVGTSLAVATSARELTDPVLDELSTSSGESSHFGTLVAGDVLYLNRRVAWHDLLSVSRIGQCKRAYGTALGKAMLARLPDEEIVGLYPEDLEPLTPNTLRTRKQLLKELSCCRQQGYASESEESTIGVRCIGMAIEAPGRLFGISLTAPVQRVSAKEFEQMAPQLAGAVDRVDKALRASLFFGSAGIEVAGGRANETSR